MKCKKCGSTMLLITTGRGFQTYGCSRHCPDSYQSLESYEIRSAAQAADSANITTNMKPTPGSGAFAQTADV